MLRPAATGLVVAALCLQCGPTPAPKRAAPPAADETTGQERQPPPEARPPARKATRRAPVNTTRVDCRQMCGKTFKRCITEVMLFSGKITAKQMELIKKAGALPKMQDVGYRACMKDCQKKGGAGPDAGPINQCLRNPDCADYAKCIQKHL